MELKGPLPCPNCEKPAFGYCSKECEAKMARKRYFKDREGRFQVEREVAEEAGVLERFEPAASDERMRQLRKRRSNG